MQQLTRWDKIKKYVTHVWNQLDRKEWAFIIGGILALVILIVFVIKPAIIGHNAYRDITAMNQTVPGFSAKVGELESTLSTTQQLLDQCATDKDALTTDIDKANAHIDTCKREADDVQGGLRTQIATLEKDVDNKGQQLETAFDARKALESELTKAQQDASQAETRLVSLARNAANNICCKNKIDDPNIDSYTLANDKITCAKGSELKISC